MHAPSHLRLRSRKADSVRFGAHQILFGACCLLSVVCCLLSVGAWGSPKFRFSLLATEIAATRARHPPQMRWPRVSAARVTALRASRRGRGQSSAPWPTASAGVLLLSFNCSKSLISLADVFHLKRLSVYLLTSYCTLSGGNFQSLSLCSSSISAILVQRAFGHCDPTSWDIHSGRTRRATAL